MPQDYQFVRVESPDRKLQKEAAQPSIQRDEIYRESASNGTSVDSLFLLLILGAMASVLLREISVHGFEPTVPYYGVVTIFIGLTTIGFFVSMITGLIYRLSIVQVILRMVAGLCVGAVGATLVVVPNQSSWTVIFTTGLGSIGLVLVASLLARAKIRTRITHESPEDQLR